VAWEDWERLMPWRLRIGIIQTAQTSQRKCVAEPLSLESGDDRDRTGNLLIANQSISHHGFV